MAEKDKTIESPAAASAAAVYGKSPEEVAAAATEAKAQETKQKGSAKETKKETKAPEKKSDQPKETRKPTKLESEAVKILKEHPEQDKVHMTSDGFGYFNEHDAWNHARTLKNDEIITIKR